MSWRDGDAPSATPAIARPHANTRRNRVVERALHHVHRPPRRRDSRKDDDIKSITGGLSPSVHSCLWDGMIQLSASVKVFMSAFFKSGEKILDIVWPDIIEIKGRVKLEDFQNFVKDLRHSRNRSIMVTALCWNVGSSEDGLQGIKEVAKRFEVSKRVGLAKIEKGPYIYVCPRSEAIITILDKYGFSKGVSTVDTNQDSLIGFVVWDRNPLVNTSTTETSIEKVKKIQGTPVEAQDVTDDFPSRYAHADKTGKSVYHSEAEIPDSPSKLASKLPDSSHDIPSPPLETQQHVRPIMDSHGGPLQVEEPNSHFHVVKNFTSAFEPYKTSVHGFTLQPLDATGEAIHPYLATEKTHIIGAFSGSITQQKYVSSDESPELQQNRPLLLNLDFSHTPDDKEDLPEYIFSPSCGAEVKPSVHPLQKETGGTGQFQQPSDSFFQAREVVGAQGTSAYMGSSKITNPISHYNMERGCFRESNGSDDGDRMMWQPSELDHKKLLKCGSYGLNPPRDEGLFFRHSPGVEIERGLFPPHSPHVPADQHLFRQHPRLVLAEQGLYPPHPPPGLPDQGFYPRHPPPGLPDQGFYPRHPPPVPADQGFFHQHLPRVLGDQSFISHRPPRCSAPGYLGSSGYPGNKSGTSPDQQHWMFGQRAQTRYASASSQHMRPPSGFAPGRVWRPMPHPRARNNHHGVERSGCFSGSSTGHYSGPGNGSASRPSSSQSHW